MIASGGHGGHVGQGLTLDLLAQRARAAPRLPRCHPLEPLLEGLELAGLVGAVAAVAAGLDRHAATFTGECRGHDESPLIGPVQAWAESLTERGRGARP